MTTADRDEKYTPLQWLWLSLVLMGLDRASKVMAEKLLDFAQPVPVIPGFFDFTLLYNTGAAFSFLAGAGGWQRWLFSAVAVIMSAVLIYWLKKAPRGAYFLVLGLASILGGALGNLYDRVFLGKVVDYLSFHFGSYSFPAFNLADVAISVGAFLLIVDMLFFEKKRLEREGEQSDK
ncbi:MAG: signal peptidase II [Pseudomonadales bacterium]